MLYICDLLFFRLISISINHITSLKHALFLYIFKEYLLLILDDNVDEESEKSLNSESSD